MDRTLNDGFNLLELFAFIIFIVVCVVVCNAILPEISTFIKDSNQLAGRVPYDSEIIMLSNIVSDSGHGLKKHGEDYLRVKQCLEDNGIFQSYKNNTTGKRINLICVPNGDEINWGIQILNKIDREITAFIKNPEFYKTLDDVIKYLTACGYTQIK